MNRRLLWGALSCAVALVLMLACGGGGDKTTTAATTPTTSRPPTSTSLTGAPSSTTPTATTSEATTTKATTSPVATSAPPPTSSTMPATSSAVPTITTATTTKATTTPPLSTTTAPPSSSGIDLAGILGQAGAITNVEYDMSITGPDMTTTGHVWVKQNKMKMQMEEEGETFVMIFDGDAMVYIMYSVSSKSGMRMAYQEPEDTPMDEAEGILDYSPRIVGTETIDGMVCTVIEYTYSEEGVTVVAKTWIWNDHGFPVKMEITSSGQTTTMLYKNIKFNTVKDSDFEVPSDVVLMSF